MAGLKLDDLLKEQASQRAEPEPPSPEPCVPGAGEALDGLGQGQGYEPGRPAAQKRSESVRDASCAD